MFGNYGLMQVQCVPAGVGSCAEVLAVVLVLGASLLLLFLRGSGESSGMMHFLQRNLDVHCDSL